MAPEWSLFSNHGLVLTTIARHPDLRLREIAAQVRITERAVQTLVGDLARAGYLERIREGRRNRYVVRGDQPITTPGHRGNELADLITALVPGPLVGPSLHPCEAVVLACSDFRYHELLRNMLAAEGLLGRAEMILLPGGRPRSPAGMERGSWRPWRPWPAGVGPSGSSSSPIRAAPSPARSSPRAGTRSIPGGSWPPGGRGSSTGFTGGSASTPSCGSSTCTAPAGSGKAAGAMERTS